MKRLGTLTAIPVTGIAVSFLALLIIAASGCGSQARLESPQARLAESQARRARGTAARPYLASGSEKTRNGDLEGAIADYTKAIELDPNNVAAYTLRASAKQKAGDREGAIADCTEAIEFANEIEARMAGVPRGGGASSLRFAARTLAALPYRVRGDAKQDLGDLDGAIADYTKAIELRADDAEAYENRGNAKTKKGDVDGALADHLKANDLKSAVAMGATPSSPPPRRRGAGASLAAPSGRGTAAAQPAEQVPLISMSTDSSGRTRTYLAGQISVSGDVSSFDNKTFACTLLQPLKQGDVIAAMTASDQAWGMNSARQSIGMNNVQFPILAMVKCSDGNFQVVCPAVFKAHFDIAAGEPIDSDGFQIEANRPVKAGESIPAVLIGGASVLSVGAAEGTNNSAEARPWLAAFPDKTTAKERSVTLEAWRLENEHVHP